MVHQGNIVLGTPSGAGEDLCCPLWFSSLALGSTDSFSIGPKCSKVVPSGFWDSVSLTAPMGLVIYPWPLSGVLLLLVAGLIHFLWLGTE